MNYVDKKIWYSSTYSLKKKREKKVYVCNVKVVRGNKKKNNDLKFFQRYYKCEIEWYRGYIVASQRPGSQAGWLYTNCIFNALCNPQATNRCVLHYYYITISHISPTKPSLLLLDFAFIPPVDIHIYTITSTNLLQ